MAASFNFLLTCENLFYSDRSPDVNHLKDQLLYVIHLFITPEVLEKLATVNCAGLYHSLLNITCRSNHSKCLSFKKYFKYSIVLFKNTSNLEALPCKYKV